MTSPKDALLNTLQVLLSDWVAVELELKNKDTINKEYLEHLKLNISHMQSLLEVIEREIK